MHLYSSCWAWWSSLGRFGFLKNNISFDQIFSFVQLCWSWGMSNSIGTTSNSYWRKMKLYNVNRIWFSVNSMHFCFHTIIQDICYTHDIVYECFNFIIGHILKENMFTDRAWQPSGPTPPSCFWPLPPLHPCLASGRAGWQCSPSKEQSNFVLTNFTKKMGLGQTPPLLRPILEQIPNLAKRKKII